MLHFCNIKTSRALILAQQVYNVHNRIIVEKKSMQIQKLSNQVQTKNNQSMKTSKNPSFGMLLGETFGFFDKTDEVFKHFISQRNLASDVLEIFAQANKSIPSQKYLMEVDGKRSKLNIHKIITDKGRRIKVSEADISLYQGDSKTWLEQFTTATKEIVKNAKKSDQLTQLAQELKEKSKVNINFWLWNSGEIKNKHTGQAMKIISRVLAGNPNKESFVVSILENPTTHAPRIMFKFGEKSPTELKFTPDEKAFASKKFTKDVKQIVDSLQN